MSNMEPAISLIEQAQEMQLAIPNCSFEARAAIVQSALSILGSQAVKREDFNANFYINALTVFSRCKHLINKKHQIVRLEDVTLEGKLQDFSYLVIGRIGTSLVSSICADLEEVALLPDGDLIPSTDTMHIPVLAITQSFKTS